MRNTLSDLNLHLFAQLERLSDEELTGGELQEEILRARSIASISEQIINNGNLVLKAKQYVRENVDAEEIPPMLKG